MQSRDLIPSPLAPHKSPVHARTQRAAILAGIAAITSVLDKPVEIPVEEGAKVTMQSMAGPSGRGFIFFAAHPQGNT